MPTITINSSNGILVADADTGIVHPHLCTYDTPPSEHGDLRQIYCIDVDEWRRAYLGEEIGSSDLDILDVGYWWTDETGIPRYEPPAYNWRRDSADETKTLIERADSAFQALLEKTRGTPEYTIAMAELERTKGGAA